MQTVYNSLSEVFENIQTWLHDMGTAAFGIDMWSYMISFAILGICFSFLISPALFGGAGSDKAAKSKRSKRK